MDIPHEMIDCFTLFWRVVESARASSQLPCRCQCIYSVSQAVNEALNADSDAYSGVIDMKLRSANELSSLNEQFKIVGLLVSLFKAVCGKTNEESLKMLRLEDDDVLSNVRIRGEERIK